MSQQPISTTPRGTEDRTEGQAQVQRTEGQAPLQRREGQRTPPSQEYAHYLSKRRHALDQYREKSNERRQKFRKLFEDAIYKDTTTYQLNF